MKTLVIGFIAGMLYVSAYAEVLEVFSVPFKVISHALTGASY